MTLYLQTLNGWTPLETALAFLPGGLLVALGSPRIGPIVDRFGDATPGRGRRAAFAPATRSSCALDAAPDYLAHGPADDAAARRRLRAGLPSLNIAGHRRRLRPRAGPASGSCRPRSRSAAPSGWRWSAPIITSQAGASTDPGVVLDAYRTSLVVVTGVAVAGLAIALSGLLPQREVAVATAD